MSKILVIAAHPDDEVLGVGATIAKRIKNGDVAFALILGEGQTSRKDRREETSQTILDELHQNSMEAAKVIGYKEIYFENFPDNRFDQVDLLDIVKIVEKYIKLIGPDIIYTHYQGDLNIDHQITFKAVLTGTRPVNNCCVKELYSFETVSSSEWNFGEDGLASFMPSIFEDVEDTFEKKLNAMKKYETELCAYPHPRSLENLEIVAKKWGSVVGLRYVEPFKVIRVIK